MVWRAIAKTRLTKARPFSSDCSRTVRFEQSQLISSTFNSHLTTAASRAPQNGVATMIAEVHERYQPAAVASPIMEDALIQQEKPLRGDSVESLFPLKEDTMDFERIEKQRRRRSSQIALTKEEMDVLEDEYGENEWNKNIDDTDENVRGTDASTIKELTYKEQEVIEAAACLGSFDKRLLGAATSLSEETISQYLDKAIEKKIIKEDVNGLHVFSTDNAQKEALGLIPSDKRARFHAAIGRNLVRRLSHDEMNTHISIILLQFHRGLQDLNSQSERNVIAGLCLRATRLAVAASDFRGACNYAELGILLLGQDCWRDEYTLSLALYNASAELLHCTGNSERMDVLVCVVLDNARCYRDTLQVRATRVHSLSSRYRMTEALNEALDILRHLGESFPSKPRKYHVMIAFLRTKRLLRGKTNEMIMRMPLMEDKDKLAALQILNLIFPIAYHTNPMLNGLFATRMVQLTMTYGLSAISTVGFASYSSMLATFSKNLDEGYRCSQLALELLDRFDGKEYIPRVYVFVYAEVLPYKLGLRKLCTFLLQAYQVGLDSGDIEVSSIMLCCF